MYKNLLLVLLMGSCFVTHAQKKKEKPAIPTAPVSTEYKVPMKPEHWEFKEGSVEFLDHKGVASARMNENSGFMILKDYNFKDGTIEFDVEVNQPGPFSTIYFHWLNPGETEHVYLRTFNYAKNNAFDLIQYASIIKGVNLWDLQHEFQAYASIKINEWNHVKLIVSGKQLKVYVNNAQEPCLEIPCMEGNTEEGRIALGTGFPGLSTFANLVIKPGVTEGLPAAPAPDLIKHDTRYIRDWQVSAYDSLPYGKEINISMLPKQDAKWEPIQTERRGMVNLSRKLGRPGPRGYVWLKAKIKTDYQQMQTLRLGFSDEIWVYINQRPIYVDKNLYGQNMRKNPNGRISIDNCSFPLPLRQGDNELLIAVSNDFFGWGIMARFENLDGIEVIK